MVMEEGKGREMGGANRGVSHTRMNPSRGITEIDGPLILDVTSDSEPGEGYIVELEPEPGAPSGVCECWNFSTIRKQLNRGGIKTMCRHIKRARRWLAFEIRAGRFDETLTRDL